MIVRSRKILCHEMNKSLGFKVPTAQVLPCFGVGQARLSVCSHTNPPQAAEAMDGDWQINIILKKTSPNHHHHTHKTKTNLLIAAKAFEDYIKSNFY